MPRIAIIIAALLGGFLSVGATGCGARSPARAPQVRISALFPAERLPLVSARLLEVLPAETLGVVIAPGLAGIVDHVLDPQGPAARPEVRAALTDVAEDLFGYDVFDIDAMRAMGVATDAPVALAALDAETGALVLPLHDRKHFNRTWHEGPATYRASHAHHAVIAFPLGASFDATSDVIRGLRVVARGLSMASHPGLRAAADRLRHGDDLLILINPVAVRRAGIDHLDEERTYYDLQTSREMVELSDPNDGDSYREARAELLVAERAVERLDTWQALLDGSMGALSGIAVGVGLDGAGVKIQAAMALTESALADPAALASATAPLPPALIGDVARGGSAAGRVPARLIVPLVGMAAGARVQQKLGDLVAALGGHAALTGAMAVEQHVRAGSGGANGDAAVDGARRALVIRLGVRNADQNVRALRGQRKLPGWSMDVDGSALVLWQSQPGLARRAHRDRSRAGGAGVRAGIQAMWLAAALGHFAMDGRTQVSAVTRAFASRAGVALSEELSATASQEQRAQHARLADRRRRLIRDHGQRLSALGTALGDWLGVAALAVQRDGATLYVHAVQALSEPDPTAARPVGQGSNLGARIAELWYEHSQYSPYGKKLAELDGELARIHATLDMNSLTELLEDEPDAELLGGSASSRLGALAGGGGGTHSGVGGGALLGGGGAAALGALSWGDTPFEPLVPPPRATVAATASITRIDSTIERALLDRALVTVTPGLHGCYDARGSDSGPASGYLRAEITVRAGAIGAIAVSPAPAGSALAGSAFLECVRSTLERALLGRTVGVDAGPAGAHAPGSASATATLWFGWQPPLPPFQGPSKDQSEGRL